MDRFRIYLLGRNKPNRAQFKFFSELFGSFAKAILVGSLSLLVLPSDEPIKYGQITIALITAAICITAGARLLKEVKS